MRRAGAHDGTAHYGRCRRCDAECVAESRSADFARGHVCPIGLRRQHASRDGIRRPDRERVAERPDGQPECRRPVRHVRPDRIAVAHAGARTDPSTDGIRGGQCPRHGDGLTGRDRLGDASSVTDTLSHPQANACAHPAAHAEANAEANAQPAERRFDG